MKLQKKKKIEFLVKEYGLMQVNFTSNFANSLQKLQSLAKLLLIALLCGGGGRTGVFFKSNPYKNRT